MTLLIMGNYKHIYRSEYLLNEKPIVFLSKETCMRKIKDDPIELTHAEITLELHFRSIDFMQMRSTQLVQNC